MLQKGDVRWYRELLQKKHVMLLKIIIVAKSHVGTTVLKVMLFGTVGAKSRVGTVLKVMLVLC